METPSKSSAKRVYRRGLRFPGSLRSLRSLTDQAGQKQTQQGAVRLRSEGIPDM